MMSVCAENNLGACKVTFLLTDESLEDEEEMLEEVFNITLTGGRRSFRYVQVILICFSMKIYLLLCLCGTLQLCITESS